jgi:uncharacterized protein (TIGR00369 family)
MTGLSDPSVGRGVARHVGLNVVEVGDWASGEVVLDATAPPRPHLDGSGGALLMGALLTMCDNVAGFCGGLAALPDGWVVSTNLMVRRTRAVVTGALRFRSTVLRRGRSAIVTDAAARDDRGPFAVATLTSAVLVPSGGPPRWTRPARLVHARDGLPAASFPTPSFYEWLGIRPAAGGVELDVTDDVRNPWGIVHGGVTASLIDAAAVAAVPGTVVDATVHFLAPARAGPVQATAAVLGRRGRDAVVRVEVRDAAAARATAIAIVTVAPA